MTKSYSDAINKMAADLTWIRSNPEFIDNSDYDKLKGAAEMIAFMFGKTYKEVVEEIRICC